jgi:hypothetical protein
MAGRVRKNHYKLGQTIVFIWSGKRRMGVIEERRPKNKKIFYNVRGDDGKLYEGMYVDDSEVAAILSYETRIVNESMEKKKLSKIESKTEETETEESVLEEFESLDDNFEDS